MKEAGELWEQNPENYLDSINYFSNIVFFNLKTPVEGNFTSLRNGHNKYHYLDIPILNALSSNLSFTLTDTQDKVVLKQGFEKRTLVEGEISVNKFSGFTLAISFRLDPSIWQSNLEWNQDHIINEIREFVYLYNQFITHNSIKNVSTPAP